MKKKKSAIVTGINGQDGAYLGKLLYDKGYNVIGTVRSLNSSFYRLDYFNLYSKIQIVECNYLENNSIEKLFARFPNIDEFYNLAAISFVYSSFYQPKITFETNTTSLIKILELIRYKYKKIKLYQASTSEIYGNNNMKIMNEKSPKIPASPYAISKLSSYHLIRMYREAYNIFCCNGILFNHESPLRGELFVTKKITKSLARYHLGLSREHRIGNIYSKRDWGFAGDFVDGMFKIIQQKKADDYVLATNTSYSIKEFIEICLEYLKIKYKWIGKTASEMKCIDKKNNKIIFKTHFDFYRPLDLNYLKGNYAKAKKELGWKPKTKLKKLAKIMIEYDVNNEQKNQNI